jgi:hypothetical protein
LPFQVTWNKILDFFLYIFFLQNNLGNMNLETSVIQPIVDRNPWLGNSSNMNLEHWWFEIENEIGNLSMNYLDHKLGAP